MPRHGRMARVRIAALALLCVLAPLAARAQYVPYFGKNKVKYDDFAWRVYKSPHFEIYYYPEFEQHLARLASYAESAYQKISSELKHEMTAAGAMTRPRRDPQLPWLLRPFLTGLRWPASCGRNRCGLSG